MPEAETERDTRGARREWAILVYPRLSEARGGKRGRKIVTN